MLKNNNTNLAFLFKVECQPADKTSETEETVEMYVEESQSDPTESTNENDKNLIDRLQKELYVLC